MIIKLTQGYTTIVDPEDYDYLTRWSWCINRGSTKIYAYRMLDRKSIMMHRVIAERAGFNIEGFQVDHIDRDGLNNQRYNLRVATHVQNLVNSKVRSDSLTGFKGVKFNKVLGKYQVGITYQGQEIHLGTYEDARYAALAYNNAAFDSYGEFAYLNKIVW